MVKTPGRAALAGLGIVIWLSTWHPAEGQIDFDTNRAYGTVTGPWDFALGDVDEDGLLDVVVVSPFVGISVHRGHPSGILQPQLPGTRLMSSTILADVDQDGHLDLAGVRPLEDVIAISLGFGNAAFAPAQLFSVGEEPVDAVSGDLNNDSFPDLVVSNSVSQDVTILLNQGRSGGEWQGFGVSATLAAEPRPSVLIADFNEDGNEDLALVNFSSQTVALLLGDGSGVHFSAGAVLPVGRSPVDLLAADFNGDGDLDLAVLSGLSAEGIDVYLGDGAGGFGPRTTFPEQRAAFLLTSDWNEDGHLDLVVANTNFASLRPGDGKGNFGPGLPVLSVGFEVETTDVDHDGHLDLIALDLGGTLLVSPGDGTGAFGEDPASFPGGLGPLAVAAADFDLDGSLDLVTSNLVGDDVSLLLNATNRIPWGLDSPRNFFVGDEPRFLAAGDFDEDGFPDLAVIALSPSGRSVAVLLTDGFGSFAGPRYFDINAFRYEALVVADFDDDGHLDIVVGQREDLLFLKGSGTGDFLPASAATYDQASSLVAGDFDGDGALDLAASRETDEKEVVLLFGDGRGAFSRGPSLPYGDGPETLTSGDFDGDGDLDLAVNVSNFFSAGRVDVIHGDGQGGISIAQSLASPPVPSYLISADVDSDGLLDLVGSYSQSGVACVYRGKGDGTFHEMECFVGGGGSTSTIVAGDLDLDGLTDLAVTDPKVPGVVVLRNRMGSLAAIQCRRGDVNRAAGPITDVLFVNGSPGLGLSRSLVLSVESGIEIRMEQPPSASGQTTPFVLYAWAGSASVFTAQELPFGLGGMCMPGPLTPRSTPQPVRIANNFGHSALLGAERWPGPPTAGAPSTLLSLSRVGQPLALFLQGLIVDAGSPQGTLAVTNGIGVVVQPNGGQ